jgi:hypothetical protein
VRTAGFLAGLNGVHARGARLSGEKLGVPEGGGGAIGACDLSS